MGACVHNRTSIENRPKRDRLNMVEYSIFEFYLFQFFFSLNSFKWIFLLETRIFDLKLRERQIKWRQLRNEQMPWSMCTSEFYAIFSLTCAPRSIHTHTYVNRFVLFCWLLGLSSTHSFFFPNIILIHWIRYGLLHLICFDVHCHFIWLVSIN